MNRYEETVAQNTSEQTSRLISSPRLGTGQRLSGSYAHSNATF